MSEGTKTLQKGKANLITIILTFNSENSVADVVESCKSISSRILVVDSGSKDKTLDIVESLGCETVEHEFEDYSMQRNWAQDYAKAYPDDWILHLDCDEVVSKELAESIKQVVAQNKRDVNGYLVKRRTYFLGKPIRFGHMNPGWHLRLYRAEYGSCEERLYDQHFIVEGESGKLDGFLLDMQLKTVEEWTSAHNRWSTSEARQLFLESQGSAGASQKTLPENLLGDIRMKRRWMKNRVYYRLPPLIRPFLFFTYSYILCLGFLDGRMGFVYHILHAFWFRFLVDVKLVEMRLKGDERGLG